MDITGLKPQSLWTYFHQLTQIPRPSGHEKAVVEYLKKFAEKKGFYHSIDATGNILIRKPAQTKRAGAAKVALQCHVDMVPQKNSDKIHDFTRDPIETIIDGEWVRANKTTLGADNGIGVAAMLAVLDSGTLEHGPLEAVFTISEETNMLGAFGLKPGYITSDMLLNLDSEDEGEIYIGCAGGIDTIITKQVETEKAPLGSSFKIEVKGLKGGHSGLDINLGRGNANKILAQLLHIAHRECDVRLHSFAGGNLRNAIPREATAVVVITVTSIEKFKHIVEGYIPIIKESFSKADPDLQIRLSPVEPVTDIIVFKDQDSILNALNTCPNGVIRMSPTLQNVVQTSTNLSIVKAGDGLFNVQCLLRSSDNTDKQNLAEQMSGLFKIMGAEVTLEGNYPGWDPNNKSLVLQKAKAVYEKLYGITPDVKVIHAGLECGIIGGVYPKLDMISFGPTIRHPHSPDEKVNIASVEKFWKFLVGVLEEV